MVKDAKKAIEEKEEKEDKAVQTDKKKHYGNKYKYYAVIKGRKPGIYLTWEECKKQVWKYKDAMYKGFYTMDMARKYLGTMGNLKKYEKYFHFFEPQPQNTNPQSPQSPNPQIPNPHSQKK